MPDAWRVVAMGREAAPQKGTFREWRCAGDIPKSCLVTDGSRCIGANQARKLGAADPMAASEKARQTNLRIGGLTRLAAPGRVRKYSPPYRMPVRVALLPVAVMKSYVSG